MGNIQVQPGLRIGTLRCPSDFSRVDQASCRIQCPQNFKFVIGSNGEVGRCVHDANNTYTVPAYTIPMSADESTFDGERSRFMEDLQKLQATIDEDQSADSALQTETNNYNLNTTEYESIKSQYSAYNNVQEATGKIKDTIEVLKPFRQPTAPSMNSQMEIERRNILDAVSQKLIMIQVALVTILICIVEYIVLPNEYAHKVAFITACVGLAVGIFLMSKK